MLTVTPPLAISADQVWVFVTGEGPAVDAARLAHSPGSETFIALPCEAFDTSSLMPTYCDTGHLIDGFRWATAEDIDDHADVFTNK